MNSEKLPSQISKLSKLMVFVFMLAVCVNVFNQFITETALDTFLRSIGTLFTEDNILNLAQLLYVVIAIRCIIVIIQKRSPTKDAFTIENGTLMGIFVDPVMQSMAIYVIIGDVCNRNFVSLVQSAYNENILTLIGFTMIWMYSFVHCVIVIYIFLVEKLKQKTA